MNKSILIGAILVLLVGGGIWYFTQNQQTQTPEQNQIAPTPTPQNNQTNEQTEQPEDTENTQRVIRYTDTGYTPNTLTVSQGETIVFHNESSKDMWPASAPHPTHTNYPEFDAKRAILPGETYEFTFTKVGSWKFHDHRDPAKFGTIIVE
ncbi:MAG: cupredoxin domain-containing protein [Candidatus Wildermuthbacteria bacterium]|nr:cupredoxin domain-containing protein [Candidatus Wildermuthbacteria bacterium]